jgi:hypothetical protein
VLKVRDMGFVPMAIPAKKGHTRRKKKRKEEKEN